MKLKEAFYLWRNTYFIVLAAKICLADFGEVFRCDIINLKRQESVGHNLEYLSATDAAVNAHGAFLQVKIHEVFPDKFMMLHVKPAHLSVFPQIQRGSELLVTIAVAVILRLPPNEDGTNEPRVFYIEVQGKVFFIHPLALCVEYTVDVVVVDSVAALVPKAEIEGSMEDQQMGLQARLMSKALRKLTGVIGKTNTTVIFINQLRMKIGVMYGNPETTTGGNALKYYASVRMEIKRTEGVKGDDGDVGNHVRVRVVKNKVAPPFRTAEFDIIFGKGICKIGNILDVAVNLDIVKKAGAWFSFNDEKLGQGRDKAKDFLSENPDVLNEVERLVREKLAG